MTTAVAGGGNTDDTRVEPEKVEQDEKAPGSRSQGPSSLGNGSSVSPMTGGRHSARAHGARTGIVSVGVVTILISAWGALIPFVEPLFGYHVTGTPSWHWNAAHTLLAVVPGAVGIAMGIVVLWKANQVRVGQSRMGRRLRESRVTISPSEPCGGLGELDPHRRCRDGIVIPVSAVKRSIGRRVPEGVIYQTC